MSDTLDRVKNLKPYRFNWISKPDQTVDGFFAHEVQGIVDEAITGEKDAMKTANNVVVNADGTVEKHDVISACELLEESQKDSNKNHKLDMLEHVNKVDIVALRVSCIVDNLL